MTTIRSLPIDPGSIDWSWMVGRTIGPVGLVGGTFPWRLELGPDARIDVQCLWRLVERGRLALTSQDHGHRFGLPAPFDAGEGLRRSLEGRTVRAVRFARATGDLRLHVSGSRRLEILPTSMGYEAWHVFAPSGLWITAAGGGELVRADVHWRTTFPGKG